jgi:8-oxo-dGTP pyrophosphatase MutT (NUDIX family)
MDRWTVKKNEDIFDGRIFTIRNLTCFHPGKSLEHDFYILHTHDWINIVALTEDGRFIMVKQHRLGTDEVTIETPAGLVEKGESPESAAKRELREETGFVAQSLTLLRKLAVNPAIMDNFVHFYLASGCRNAGSQRLDAAEDIEVLLYSRDEVIGLIQQGEISHSLIITALSLYFASPSDGGNPRPLY